MALVVGYYTSWSSYEGYKPDQIHAQRLTHIHYAFAEISPELTVRLADPDNDIQNFAAFQLLKSRNPSLKVLISVGGWDYSRLFSDVALTEASRTKFAQSCIELITTHKLDGVDIDWEYPGSGGRSGNITRPEDKQNFTLLLKALRAALDAQGQKDGKKYDLSFAGGAFNEYLNHIEPAAAAAVVDYVFLMAYDFNMEFAYSGFNAPLFQPQKEPPRETTTVSQSVQLYLDANIPANKIVLGTPFYGYSYDVTTDEDNGLYSTYTFKKPISFNEVFYSYLSKPDVDALWEPGAKVPYIFYDFTFISYDDAASLAEKSSYAKSQNLLGIGAWELSNDRSGMLLDAISK